MITTILFSRIREIATDIERKDGGPANIGQINFKVSGIPFAGQFDADNSGIYGIECQDIEALFDTLCEVQNEMA